MQRESNTIGIMFKLLLIAALLFILPITVSADQAVLHMAIGDPARKDREVPLVLDGITDTATGEIITSAEMAVRLEDTGLLFLGETHTNLDFHKVQLHVLRELHESGREVLIGLEMFPYTQQNSLDNWNKGLYSEDGFVELAGWYKYWSYNWGYYRDIFLFARDNGLRMFAINTPRDVVTAVRKKGFGDLTEEEAAHIPSEVAPVTDDQRKMYNAFFDVDDSLHRALDEDALEGMYRAQTTWDATMGFNALQALKTNGGPNAIMVVLIGSGHVTFGLGSERQTAPHYDGKISSIIPISVFDDEGQPVREVRASYANFLWGLPKEEESAFPSLGVSLMGSLGAEPMQIIQVSPGSVGDMAGLSVGDVLISIDGQVVDTSVALRKIVSEYRWGDVATAKISRENEIVPLEINFRRCGIYSGN
jgi:uncharacterized iron-regulated protein